MADKYEMGEMPSAPESDEMDMDGMDYQSHEEEGGSSDVEGLKSQIADLSESDLKEVEAAVADALSKVEEEDAEAPMADDEGEAEAPESESDAGDLSALFS